MKSAYTACIFAQKTKVSTAYLLLGSNEGDRTATLDHTITLLSRDAGRVVRCSAVYQTAAWGKEDQPDFLNQAVELLTSREPHDLLRVLQSIEQLMGRQRLEKWGQRTLDIDLLFFDDRIINTPDLCVPHPGLPHRRFVLQPLCDIAPLFRHPQSGLSVEELLQQCNDLLPVNKLK